MPLAARPYLWGSALMLVIPLGTFQFSQMKGLTNPPRHMSICTGTFLAWQQGPMMAIWSQVPQGQLGYEVQTQMVFSSIFLFISLMFISQFLLKEITRASMLRQSQALWAATWPVSQMTRLGFSTPSTFILYSLQAKMAMRMDSVPPELHVPQDNPFSSLRPIASAVMSITSFSICFTKGNIQMCSGFANENIFDKFATNLLWLSRAYREPDSLPFRASFSEASPRFTQGALQGTLSSLGSRSAGYSARISVLAFSKFLATSFLTGPRLKTRRMTAALMRLGEMLATQEQSMQAAMTIKLRMMNFSN